MRAHELVRESMLLISALSSAPVSRRANGAAFTTAWDHGNIGPDNPAITPKSPIILFNGRDLTNFYHDTRESKLEDPTKVLTIANGILRISGQEWESRERTDSKPPGANKGGMIRIV